MVNEVLFLGFWAELPDAGKVRAYRSYIDAYVSEQKKLGRFPHPPNNRVTSLLDLMEELRVVPPQTKALAAISLLFLVVAALNLIGLFLGKFLARASNVGVRRALGASRWTIFVQHLVECELMGLAGGCLGVLLSVAGLAVLNRVYGDGPEGVAVLPARRPHGPRRRGPVAPGRDDRRPLPRVADLRRSARPSPEEPVGGPPWNSDPSSVPSCATARGSSSSSSRWR